MRRHGRLRAALRDVRQGEDEPLVETEANVCSMLKIVRDAYRRHALARRRGLHRARQDVPRPEDADLWWMSSEEVRGCYVISDRSGFLATLIALTMPTSGTVLQRERLTQGAPRWWTDAGASTAAQSLAPFRPRKPSKAELKAWNARLSVLVLAGMHGRWMATIRPKCCGS
jgi:hypothetical protein